MDGRWYEWYESILFNDEPVPVKTRPSRLRLSEPLKQARELARTLARQGRSREAIFVEQGRLLSDYEDETEYLQPVLHYYPTYESLSDEELRGYFGWRTRWRRGEAREGQLSFVFLHIYELLNQIGVADPMDGWRQLLRFWDPEGEGRALVPYLRPWLRDYVVYYGLSPDLLADWPEVRRGRAIHAMLHAGSDEELVTAAAELCGYSLERSLLLRSHRAEYMDVTARVLRTMALYYEKHRKGTLWQYYFGSSVESAVTLFDRAVFYQTPGQPSRTYALTPLTVYRFCNRCWTVEHLDTPAGGRNRLGLLLKEIDGQLRLALGVGRPLKPALSTKWVLTIVEREIAALLERRRREEAHRVRFDLSRLAGIRADAEVTRDRLLTEQELETETVPDSPAPKAEAPPEASSASPEVLPLEAPELRLLRCLLYGGETDWLAREGHMASLLWEGINEKLYDLFSDTVLDEEGQLIPDYIDDLKEMVSP